MSSAAEIPGSALAPWVFDHLILALWVSMIFLVFLTLWYHLGPLALRHTMVAGFDCVVASSAPYTTVELYSALF